MAYSKGSRHQTIGEIPPRLTASTLWTSLHPIPESSSPPSPDPLHIALPPSPEITSTRVVTEGRSTYAEAELVVPPSKPDYSVYPQSTVVHSPDLPGHSDLSLDPFVLDSPQFSCLERLCEMYCFSLLMHHLPSWKLLIDTDMIPGGCEDR